MQGTLGLLVLKSLQSGPMNGWDVTLHIQNISQDVLRVEEGSLYPALHRMEQQGWIRSAWGVSQNNRRARFYQLTPAGRRQLEAEENNWRSVSKAVARVLAFEGGEA